MRFRFLNSSDIIGMWRDPALQKPIQIVQGPFAFQRLHTINPCAETSPGFQKYAYTSVYARTWWRGWNIKSASASSPSPTQTSAYLSKTTRYYTYASLFSKKPAKRSYVRRFSGRHDVGPLMGVFLRNKYTDSVCAETLGASSSNIAAKGYVKVKNALVAK